MDPSPIFQLVYASSAANLFTAGELGQLLEQSRSRNQQLGISGILLYKDGNLMQLLEGDESKVTALYTKISRDPRHHGAIILVRQCAQRRLFADWSMGFRNLDDENVRAMPGFNDVFDRPLNSADWSEGGKCLRLLGIFREKM